jgi:hypothetical protein
MPEFLVPRHHRWHLRVLSWSCVAITAATLSMTAGTAAANWKGPQGAGGGGGGGAGACLHGTITQDKTVSFFNVDPSSDLSNASSYVRNTTLSGTALTRTYASNQTTTVDILLGDQYYDSFCEATLGVQWTTDGVYGLRGMTSCDYLDGNRCDQGVVRVSNYFFDAHGNAGDRWIVCHEVGHAIGLKHRDAAAGCMYNSADTSTVGYTTHDKDHFSANWANEPAS